MKILPTPSVFSITRATSQHETTRFNLSEQLEVCILDLTFYISTWPLHIDIADNLTAEELSQLLGNN